MSNESNKYTRDSFTQSWLRLKEKFSTDEAYPTLQSVNEGTLIEFLPIFHFDAPGGLFAEDKHKNSALAHLKRIGETERYDMLKKFHNYAKALMEVSPWCFKQVEGLAKAMRWKINEPAFGDDNIIKFDLYESLDWRMQTFIELYMSIVYDYNRGVEVIPRNLQRFSMSIYIRDIRILADHDGTTADIFGNTDRHYTTGLTAMNHRLVHLGKCRILYESGTAAFDSINNTDFEELVLDLQIEYKFASMSSKFQAILGDYTVKADTRENSKQGMKLNNANKDSKQQLELQKKRTGIAAIDAYNEKLKALETRVYDMVNPQKNLQKLERIGEDALGQVVNLVGGAALGLLQNNTQLYNVYDMSPADYFALLDADSLGSLTGSLDKITGGNTSLPTSLPVGNIFG